MVRFGFLDKDKNTPIPHRSRVGLRIVALCGLSTFLFASYVIAQTFNGPQTSAGQGQGAIGVDSSGDLSIGTSTPISGVKLLLVGTSTTSGYYALEAINKNASPLLYVRSDGSIMMGTASPNAGAIAGLTVANNLYVGGTISGAFLELVPAPNVTAGVFGAGNFAFPSSLGINTSTSVGLPQALSVNGGGYFSGSVGVGMNPGVIFDINAGAATVAQSRITSHGSDSAISLKNTGSGGREYWIDSGSSGAGIGSGNFAVYDYTAGASRIVVNSSGNVGIGTTSPGYKLDVEGGNINSSGAYQEGGIAGISAICSAGQVLTAPTISGGIVTAGVCASSGGGGTVTAVTGSGNISSSGGTTPNITFAGTLPIANGGTGTASPSLVAGSGINISGSWPNNTIALTGTAPVISSEVSYFGGSVSVPNATTD